MLHHRESPLLIIEDSDEDWETFRRIFSTLGVSAPLKRFARGDEALAWLAKTNTPAQRHLLPRLMLLDLNLPGMSGHEVLAEIKTHPVLRAIPLLVLTTSANPRDVQTTYLSGANSYLVKPVGIDSFTDMLDQVRRFWMETAILPPLADA